MFGLTWHEIALLVIVGGLWLIVLNGLLRDRRAKRGGGGGGP
jgi:hypothetical protein